MLNYTTQQTIIQMFRMFFDILILWVLLYYTIKIVRNNSRTAQIFKGIIFILIIRAIANFFGFKAVDWLAGVLVTYGFLAIIIIFQPEIRSILEKLGKSSVFSRLNTLSVNERLKLVDELVTATVSCSQNKIGALITLEQGHSLSDFIKTGTPMNSLVTAELLQTIFMPTTPLHDGAVIIQGDRIACASAYFPPTNLEVPSRYGARHRAAIGISEITDSVTIVVSEKSGRISIAEEGKLTTMTHQTLRTYLEQVILQDEEEVYHADPSKVIPPIAKEDGDIPKPIRYKSSSNDDNDDTDNKPKFTLNFRGFMNKKVSNPVEETKPVDELEEINEKEPPEEIENVSEDVKNNIEEVSIVEEANTQEEVNVVKEDPLEVTKKSIETERKRTFTSMFRKKKAVVKKEEVVEKIEEEETEIIINDPLEEKVVDENQDPKQKQMPHIKLEYSVSDDTLLDDEEEEVSKGGEQK